MCWLQFSVISCVAAQFRIKSVSMHWWCRCRMIDPRFRKRFFERLATAPVFRGFKAWKAEMQGTRLLCIIARLRNNLRYMSVTTWVLDEACVITYITGDAPEVSENDWRRWIQATWAQIHMNYIPNLQSICIFNFQSELEDLHHSTKFNSASMLP